nr:hypothetical protein [Tanacetum cinerariifolium]
MVNMVPHEAFACSCAEGDVGFGTCSVLFGFQLVLLYELTMEKGFLIVKGRGIGNDDKEKTTTSVDDPAKDENGANKATNFLYQDVSPPVIANHTSHGKQGEQRSSLDNFPSITLAATVSASIPAFSGPTSHDKFVNGEQSRKSVNFCTLIAPVGNGAHVAIHLESIRAISERLVNSAYDFFLEKRVAYLVVANYVKNTWRKYGLVKSMLNSSNGLIFFPFSFEDGLDAMLENGTPLILDSYTFDMYMQSWGRLSYARAMIDMRADEVLNVSIMVAMPKLIGMGFNMCHVRVEPISNKNGASTGGKMKPKVSTQENPLVPTSNMDSESEVEAVFDETVNLMASTSFKGGSDRDKELGFTMGYRRQMSCIRWMVEIPFNAHML